jgi:hypothetical protein
MFTDVLLICHEHRHARHQVDQEVRFNVFESNLSVVQFGAAVGITVSYEIQKHVN